MTGNELREWRRDRVLDQQDLADLLGVHLQTVSKWERNVQTIPPFLELALRTVEREQKLYRTRAPLIKAKTEPKRKK
jgi:transcriptional regulator with XRE-family HTH domain